MAVPYTFGTATASIPLSQLDSNFATVITLGNTAIQLGNTVTTLNNMTLANVTISSGNVTLTNVAVTTANVTTANITTAVIGTATITTSTITSSNVTTANITTANITTDNITSGTVSTSLTLSYGTANAVAYLNGSKVVTTGSALTFDGTNFATTGTATATKLIPTGTSVTGNGMYLPATNAVGISTNGTNAVYIDASQNVGIGIVPSAWSVIKPVQVGYAALGAYLTNLYSTINTYFDGSNWKYITTDYACRYQQSSGQHQWYTAPSGTAGNTATFTQVMTLDNSGNLLVGTTTVVNTGKVISAFNGSSAVGFVANDTASASGGVYYGCSLNGTFIGSVQRVGATSAVVYNTTSDQRLKSNITDSNSVLPTLMNVKVRQYDWTDGDFHQEYGFIAQELEPILSGVVTKGKTDDDMWQLDYSRLTPHLVKAIQEQQALITSLTDRIAALEAA